MVKWSLPTARVGKDKAKAKGTAHSFGSSVVMNTPDYTTAHATTSQRNDVLSTHQWPTKNRRAYIVIEEYGNGVEIAHRVCRRRVPSKPLQQRVTYCMDGRRTDYTYYAHAHVCLRHCHQLCLNAGEALHQCYGRAITMRLHAAVGGKIPPQKDPSGAITEDNALYRIPRIFVSIPPTVVWLFEAKRTLV